MDIPEIILKSVSKQLKISNPPSLQDVEIVTLHCVSAYLSSDIFDDYFHVYDNPQQVLEALEEETEAYVKDLEDRK